MFGVGPAQVSRNALSAHEPLLNLLTPLTPLAQARAARLTAHPHWRVSAVQPHTGKISPPFLSDLEAWIQGSLRRGRGNFQLSPISFMLV